MNPTCTDCGKQHANFLEGVVCDVAHYGPDGALQRLSKFMEITAAADLVAAASTPRHL